MKVRRWPTSLVLTLGVLTVLALAGPVGAQESLTVQLGAQNNSGQAGTATLTALGGGQTRVVVTLANSPAGPQPIHIHEGACAALNPAPRVTLTPLADGRSETTVDLPLAALLAQPHAINAHKSQPEISVYVACGDITLPLPAAAPRTGGGGLAPPARWPWALAAALLTLGLAGGLAARRRRQV